MNKNLIVSSSDDKYSTLLVELYKSVLKAKDYDFAVLSSAFVPRVCWIARASATPSTALMGMNPAAMPWQPVVMAAAAFRRFTSMTATSVDAMTCMLSSGPVISMHC